ncbi:MAG: radical SAM protein [Candidatus Korobacteraceae bacterium]
MCQSNAIDALFVGWENQENLGLRYIMALLHKSGYRTQLAPYSPGAEEEITRVAMKLNPKLIGFSIIFQYSLREFGSLMCALRQAGVQSHFTAGGHYPSLCPVSTFEESPDLNSIVRFEGELTTRELLENLAHPEVWDKIPGLAFRCGEDIAINPPRPLVEPLDSLPWPVRGEALQAARGIPIAPMLASRGCLFDCSFCSIRQFYAGAPGPNRRTRSALDVAEEMKELYETRGVQLFLFQDDDFAAKTTVQRRWIDDFLLALDEKKLTGKIGWKISCRVDDVDRDLMGRCRERGLLAVYLGVESGNTTGLAVLNKRATVERNLQAMQDIRDAGLVFDMGFMLLDPASTFDTLRENVSFLRAAAALGGPPLSFVKMLPLAGTTIQKQLEVEGRLMGDPVRPDYRFSDARLDNFALWITLRFSARNSSPNGLVERMRIAYFDHLVAQTFEPAPWVGAYGTAVRQLIDLANDSALTTLERALAIAETCPDADSIAVAWRRLNDIAADDRAIQAHIFSALDAILAQSSPTLCAAMRQIEPDIT